jgi:HPt (histidine-containing phosphotransfer) domain-containing protein
MKMDQTVLNQECVYSRLATDPDLRDVVDLFVEEMPGRVVTLLEKLQAADWEGLRRTAHQLKGAAGSYGFDGISPCAGKVESAVRDGEPEERIRATVEELVALCSRTRCGPPAQQPQP